MGYTISTHNGSVVHREHNRRNPNVVSKQTHIDPNGVCKVLRDEPIKQAYHRLFDKAVKEYNDKQSRADRKIDNYYKSIQEDAKKHTCYEMIVTVGNMDNKPDEQLCEDILQEFVDSWDKRNPNLEIIGAYLHLDEATPHLHIDYIPVSRDCSRGLSVQNSLSGALREQGFEQVNAKETRQIQWQRSENRYLEQLCVKRGLDIEHPKQGREHIRTEEYKAMEHTRELKQEQERLFDQIEDFKRTYEAKPKEVKKDFLGRNKDVVELSVQEYQQLHSLAVVGKQAKDLEQDKRRCKQLIENCKARELELQKRIEQTKTYEQNYNRLMQEQNRIIEQKVEQRVEQTKSRELKLAKDFIEKAGLSYNFEQFKESVREKERSWEYER